MKENWKQKYDELQDKLNFANQTIAEVWKLLGYYHDSKSETDAPVELAAAIDEYIERCVTERLEYNTRNTSNTSFVKMSNTYNPKRDEPKTYNELLSWICIRLSPNERAVSSKWKVWWYFNTVTNQEEWSMTVSTKDDLLHLPHVAYEFDKHWSAIEHAECEKDKRQSLI